MLKRYANRDAAGPFHLPCEAKDRALLEGSDLHGVSMYSVQYPCYASKLYDLDGQRRSSARSHTAYGVRSPAAVQLAGGVKVDAPAVGVSHASLLLIHQSTAGASNRFDAMTTYQAEYLHAACTAPLQSNGLRAAEQHKHGLLALPARCAVCPSPRKYRITSAQSA